MKHAITNISNNTCTGCGACVSACPNQCITLEYDREGFTVARVRETDCVDCGKCVSVCHVRSPLPRKEYRTRRYAAVNKNREIALKSSTSGIFWVLAKWIVEKRHGVVYGAILDDDLIVRHARGETLQECKPFRRSKYLQSNTQRIFPLVREDLENNRTVLFSGVPCQIAALYKYLGKTYENLYTVDLLCHGAPSQGLYNAYRKWLENKHGSDVTNINWRDKREMWMPSHMSYQFREGGELYEENEDNLFQKGYVRNIYLRYYCYHCAYARVPRVGDITLGDDVRYQGELIEERRYGISVVAVSSRKGEELFQAAARECKYHEVPLDANEIGKVNHLLCPPKWNNKRPLFFNDYFRGTPFDILDKRYIHQSSLTKWIVRFRQILVLVGVKARKLLVL